MICPECNGGGESIYYIETHRDENSVTVEQRKGICRTCNGSGEKKQTNADRIRAMSDELLASQMVVVVEETIKAITDLDVPDEILNEVRSQILERLKQSAEGTE